MKLIKKPEIEGRLLRFICSIFMLSIVIYLLINVKFIVALIFGFYPTVIAVNLGFQAFGYDPFNRITNKMF